MLSLPGFRTLAVGLIDVLIRQSARPRVPHTLSTLLCLALVVPTARSATGADGDRENRAASTSTAPLDAQGLLAKLKEMDARFESGFTATGSYVRGGRWPLRMKWKATAGGGKMIYQEEVTEILQAPSKDGDRRGPLTLYGGGAFTVLRTTFFVGPEYYAVYDWTGRNPPAGPIPPWPEGEKGLATAGCLTIYSLNDPAYLWHIYGTVQVLGRGYSRYIDEITGVYHREDGLTSFTADGTMYKMKTREQKLKWVCLVDPKAAYMIRSANVDVVGGKLRSEKRLLSGAKWDGPLCFPETVKGTSPRAVASASSKPDWEFLEKTEAALHGPYLIHTDWHDERGDKRLYKSIKAGGSWPGE